jgi:eukaryotic-like serine/threonine-protein kinase
VFSFGRLEDGRLYFIMEMLEGETLQAYLKRRSQLELDEALQIFTAIASALEASHAAGIVHRDLKPSNVFLSVDASGDIMPKLLDFGVAKVQLSAQSLELTGEGNIVGTPTYMAPEQSLGGEVGPGADVYALGVMLHRALTGRLPFERENALGMAVAHATLPPPAMSEVRPEMADLDDLVLRMLAKDPAERPGSAREAIAELAAIVRRRGGSLPLLAQAASVPVDVSAFEAIPKPPRLPASLQPASLRPLSSRRRPTTVRARALRKQQARRSLPVTEPATVLVRRRTLPWAHLAVVMAALLVAGCLAWVRHVVAV